jgi:hypothetical protein
MNKPNGIHEDLAVWFGKKKKPKGSSQPKGPWVNICKTNKDGSHPPCGRTDSDGDGKKDGAYPKCRAVHVAAKMSDSAKKKACAQKRRAEKKNPKSGTGNKPTMVSNKNLKEMKLTSIVEDMMRIGDETYSNITVDDRAINDSIPQELIDDIAKAAKIANVKVEISYAKKGHKKTTKSGNISRHWRQMAVDLSRLQDLENPEETEVKSSRRNRDGFKTAGDRLCDALESLGYNRNAEGSRNPKAVLWYMPDGTHKNHLHVSNTNANIDNDEKPTSGKNEKPISDKKEYNVVKADLMIKDIIENGDNSELLARGSKGEGVKELQQLLIDKGYSLPKSGVDGIYGRETAKAVKEFQKDSKIKVDGIVGIETSKSLFGLKENKVTKIIRLTESDLYRIIEGVKKDMSERQAPVLDDVMTHAEWAKEVSIKSRDDFKYLHTDNFMVAVTGDDKYIGHWDHEGGEGYFDEMDDLPDSVISELGLGDAKGKEEFTEAKRKSKKKKKSKKRDTTLCKRGKDAAKAKYDVYPSAYANGYAVQVCKGEQPDRNGVTRCSGKFCK